MGWLRSLSSSFRANRKEAQAIAENIIWKEVCIPARRGAERITGIQIDINQMDWYHAHWHEEEQGFMVTAIVYMEEAFKVKKQVEADINFCYMKYKEKNISDLVRKRMTKPTVRVDATGIYFDIFVSFS